MNTRSMQVKKEEASLTEPVKMKKGDDWSGGDGFLPSRETLGPLFLMLTTPAFSIVLAHVCSSMGGDFVEFFKLCISNGSNPIVGIIQTIYSIWPSPWDLQAWKMIISFLSFELVLQRYMPGKTFVATTTPKGNKPTYVDNGMASYLFTLFTFLLLTYVGLIRPALVYDKFGEILSAMNVFALLFCVMLLVKGHVAPSSTDSGTNGSHIMDFYWGMELYPRIFGWDVKMFTNCRAGMMFWAVGILCFAHKNAEVNGGTMKIGMAVNVALQLIYISKFFHWEMGYMCSMDIQHDRAGYYICWGCLVWVPSVYTSHSFYLAKHAPDLSLLVAFCIFLPGVLCIWINYDADNQRSIFRATNGECFIWGHKPKKIVAEYTCGTSGEAKKSLLLVDGWWKVSRHFHYIPEILGSFFWSLPALNTAFVGPYFYVVFLTILLVDRAFRDDDRCRRKYKQYWESYCTEVPYKIIPFIL